MSPYLKVSDGIAKAAKSGVIVAKTFIGAVFGVSAERTDAVDRAGNIVL
jgi:hypothetical protein